MTSLLPEFNPPEDDKDSSPPRSKPRRCVSHPQSANVLQGGLPAPSPVEAGPSGSPASPADCLQDAITRLSSLIKQLDQLYRAAESIEDKIRLSSALGIAAARLSNLLRTQKYLSPDPADEFAIALDEVLTKVNKEWGRI